MEQPWKFLLEKKLHFIKNVRIDSDKKEIIFDGEVNIDEPIYIPENYQVTVKAGSMLIFTNFSFLISESPVSFKGETNRPILMNGDHGTSGAILILKASRKSVLQNVIFADQNTLNYHRWTLSGGLIAYQTEIEIEDCVFKNIIVKMHSTSLVRILDVPIRYSLILREMDLMQIFAKGK